MVYLLAWLRSSFLRPLISMVSLSMTDVFIHFSSRWTRKCQKAPPVDHQDSITFFFLYVAAALLLMIFRILTANWMGGWQLQNLIWTSVFLDHPSPPLQVEFPRKQIHHTGTELGNVLGNHACRREEKEAILGGNDWVFSLNRLSMSLKSHKVLVFKGFHQN